MRLTSLRFASLLLSAGAAAAQGVATSAVATSTTPRVAAVNVRADAPSSPATPGAKPTGSAPTTQADVLTTALAVRSLSPAEAERGRDVRLRGVVVFVEGASAIFVQDETSTTFFRRPSTDRVSDLPAVGDEIEVTGKTRMGLYLPGLDYSTFKVLGRRALPPGIPARYDDLVFSRYHYQRVALEGIVRSVRAVDARRSLIRLALGTRVIEARVEKPPQPDRSLVDCRVRVTGLAVGLINKRRQLVQPYVRVVDWTEVEVLAPAPPVAEVPLISAEELLAFRVSGHGEQRVKLEGAVTAVFPGDHVFLQQADRAFRVRFGSEVSCVPGERVTVVGFPQMEGSSASVVDAEVLRRESGPPPIPENVASPEAFDETHDCKLIRVAGTVRDVFKVDDGLALVLAGRERTVQVRLAGSEEPPGVGARVQVTGIAQLELGGSASGFGTASATGPVLIRTRTPADVTVLRKPSVWTTRRLVGVLAAFAGLMLLAGLWIAILRRQVRRQTAALRERIASEAALQERQRLAREFHDTLEQELAGVSLRLDALATREFDDKGRQLIAASRNLVGRIQTETRDLISDLRDATEIAGDLVTALDMVAHRQSTDTGTDVRVEAPSPLPALPAATVHDLRMMAREAVTNAIKHGRATHVIIQAAVRDGQLVVQVIDNGCGFDPDSVARAKRGHFGCAGIRERGRKIAADVTWHSALQRGTTMEITLPLAPTGAKLADAVATATVPRDAVAAPDSVARS